MALTLEQTANLLPGLQTLRSLVEKAHYDLDRFETLTAEPYRSWALADLATSLWHLLDWSYELYEHQRYATLEDWRDAMISGRPQFTWVADLCNAYKHRRLARPKSDVVNFGTSGAALPEDEEVTNLGTAIIRRKRDRGGEEMVVHQVVWGDGESDRIHPHLRSVLREWDKYIDTVEPM